MNYGLRPLPAFLAVAAVALSIAAEEPQVKLARPTPQQVAWQHMELQMFVCLDPCAWQDRDYDTIGGGPRSGSTSTWNVADRRHFATLNATPSPRL